MHTTFGDVNHDVLHSLGIWGCLPMSAFLYRLQAGLSSSSGDIGNFGELFDLLLSVKRTTMVHLQPLPIHLECASIMEVLHFHSSMWEYFHNIIRTASS